MLRRIQNTIQGVGKLAGLSARPLPSVGQTPHEVVHNENKWRLLRFGDGSRRDGEAPILVVPSMINRWYVLDLMPGRSLVEWLVDQGHDVFVIDWGTPRSEDRFLSFDDVVGRYLRRAITRAAQAAGSEKVHLLGYCMGGTMTAIHAAVYPERVASLTTLAAPVAFDDESLLSTWAREPSFQVDRFVDAVGNAPWPLLQAAFLMLRPTLNLSKLVFLVDQAFVEQAWNDEFLNGFFAKERWANDNVSLPGEVFRTWLSIIYRDDAIMNGKLRLDGHKVDLRNLRMPLHVVTFEHDYIVPERCAEPLGRLPQSDDIQVTKMRGGHIGAVVSSSAAGRLWPKLDSFWRERRPSLRIVRESGSI